MKKLHVLIPSLVATASMPLIGLVGCGDDANKYIAEFNRSWYSTSGSNYRYYLSTESVDVKAGIKYTIIFDMGKYDGPDFSVYGFCFAQGFTDTKPNLVDFSTDDEPTINKLAVNGHPIPTPTAFSNDSPYREWLSASNPFDDNMFSELAIFGLSYNHDDKIEMQLTFNKDWDDLYFFSQGGIRTDS